MMTPKYVIVLVLALSSMWVMSMAQTGVSGDCTNELVTLSPCLDYITGNSSTPTRSCCSQLANVVRSSPQCLCQLLNGGAASFAASLNINQTLALTLPNACNVQTPPLSTCNGKYMWIVIIWNFCYIISLLYFLYTSSVLNNLRFDYKKKSMILIIYIIITLEWRWCEKDLIDVVRHFYLFYFMRKQVNFWMDF